MRVDRRRRIGPSFALVLAVVAACGDNSRPAIVPDPGCEDGFVEQGDTCADVDECALELDDCDARATCTNTPGTFACACAEGWTGDGKSCALAPCRFDYRAGHGDMYTTWNATTGLTMAVRSELEPGMGERAYPPLEVCIHVPRSMYDAIVELGGRPPGAGWDPIGVAAGEPFWFLSETPIAATPWFGIASDLSPAGGVPIGVFGDFLTLTLAVDAPPGGQLSTWGTVDDPETPPFLFSTRSDLEETELITGQHGHMSWGFTRAGEYLVEAVITGRRIGTNEVVASPPVTYRFIVEM